MKKELLDIANKVRTLYLKYGIKSISMDDVARELGISKKTLYQHIEDKEQLVKLVVELELEHRLCGFAEIFEQNLSAIDELIETHKLVKNLHAEVNPAAEYDLRKYYPELYKLVQHQRIQKATDFNITNLQKGITQGWYRLELSPIVIAKFYVASISAFILPGFFTPEELADPITLRQTFVYHLHGICNEKGLKYFYEKYPEYKIK